MSDTNTTATTPAETTVQAPKAPTSVIRTLTDGATQRLQVNAIANKNDWSCYILLQEVGADKKLKTIQRGATERVADLTEAQAYVAKVVKQAVKDGWKVPEGPKGFEARPDTFTLKTIPKPKK
jgi:hypothetical protein